MARGLKRLLELRLLEEEQSRLRFERAAAELEGLERAVQAAFGRARSSREMVRLGVRTGEPIDRAAGIEQERAAERGAHLLGDAIAAARPAVEEARASYLAARIERRQVETLRDEALAGAYREQDRRSQQALDDLYGGMRQRTPRAPERTAEAPEDSRRRGKS